MGNGLGFRPNTFDGCVSISAVQWLCYSHRSEHVPHKRLRAFFSSLYSCLRRGARAAIQLYPETPEQMEMITNAAMSAGFTGGVVVDYPNSTKAKKYYLVLFAGTADKQARAPQQQQQYALPKARGVGAGEIEYERARNTHGGGGGGGRHHGKRARGHHGGESSGGGAAAAAAAAAGGRPAKKSRAWIEKKKDVQRKQGRDVRPDSKFTGRKRSGKLW
jgi:18S rRNA (guanine1575-N7)-methyltransferase